MATKYNIQIDQGSTFSHNFVLKDASNTVIDISGYSSRGQIRAEYTDANADINLTTLITDAANGVVNISLTSAQTKDLTAQRYVYDVELINTTDDSVTRVVQGNVHVYPEATKDTDGPPGAEVVV